MVALIASSAVCHSRPRPLHLREERLQSLFAEGDLAVLGRWCGVLGRGLALLLLRGRVGGIAAVVDDLPYTFLALLSQRRGSDVVNRGRGALLHAVISLSDSLVLLLGCGVPCGAESLCCMRRVNENVQKRGGGRGGSITK